MAGAPSKYRETYCNEVVSHCAEGASLTSFAAEIGVSRATINVWMEAHPQFLEAVTKAKAKCAAWWEKIARESAAGMRNGNATLCVFGLKNMGADDWHDKREVEHSGTLNIGAALDALDDDGEDG